jgi:hypothetical protein
MFFAVGTIPLIALIKLLCFFEFGETLFESELFIFIRIMIWFDSIKAFECIERF